MKQLILRLLAHPLTRGLSIDDPRTTVLRREIIRTKPFLKQIYDEWYAGLAGNLPEIEGPVVELGSGAGYLAEVLPEVITSEVFFCEHTRIVLDATRIPFPDASLRAVVMTDVLHHIPNCRGFLREAIRSLRPGGRIVMLEPWVSPWSKWVYQNLHHEPFRPEAEEWEFPSDGPLSGANGALPWIIFERDRGRFTAEFPQLEILKIEPTMPFRYLVSGGVATRDLMPIGAAPLWETLERSLGPRMKDWCMFALIVVEKRE